MNVFYEFHKIVQQLERDKVPYALIGGVAMAFHSYARFTKDVDILTAEAELESIKKILISQGYHANDQSMSFKSGLTLLRFWKFEEGDEMIIDVLMGSKPRHQEIIHNALETYSPGTGIVRVASKKDLIWLKSQRNSTLDKADIEHLKESGAENKTSE